MRNPTPHAFCTKKNGTFHIISCLISGLAPDYDSLLPDWIVVDKSYLGQPQSWTSIAQTDGRRFICDLNNFNKNPKWIKDLIVWAQLFKRWQRCWWHRYVGDFMMMTDFRCWWQNHYIGDFFRYVGDFLNVLNRSPTSQTCHQHIWSPTSVTNIDLTIREIFVLIWLNLNDFRSK